jgi:hypothetical protein
VFHKGDVARKGFAASLAPRGHSPGARPVCTVVLEQERTYGCNASCAPKAQPDCAHAAQDHTAFHPDSLLSHSTHHVLLLPHGVVRVPTQPSSMLHKVRPVRW